MTANSPDAASKRIPWRKRADLQCVPLEFEGRPAWGIKDPLTLGYFELREEAYFVLNQLDGQTSSEQLCQRFHERFRPRTLSFDELNGFLAQLVLQGLVIAESPGYGKSLVARQQTVDRRRRWGKLGSLLAIRFRGIDPDRFLGWMLTWMGWIFSPWTIGLGCLLMVSAVTLVIVQFDELLVRLPDAQALLSVTNLVWLALLMAIVKVVHEFGHGLTCKRFGGECHELGVMLLVFSPTLYCNVSDIWMVRDKWQRIAVSAAGMMVEAVIASVCTLLWWYSAPGLFHSLCLNLMFLCGVSTFLFNGNPLLRYDGYFVLADWLEIPNLQQQSLQAVRGTIASWFCGNEFREASDRTPHREWGLIAYGVASIVYRLFVTLLIYWALYGWLEPIGFGAIAQVMAGVTLSLMVLSPIAGLIRFFGATSNRRRIDWFRLLFRGGIAVGGLALLFNVPLPNRVTAEAMLDDGDAQRVYVTFAGTLLESVSVGQKVEAGQEIARLNEPRLLAKLTQLQGELNQKRLRLEQLERRRISEPNVAQEIPTVREVVRDLEQQLAQRLHDADRLILRSPCSGTVLPAPPHHAAKAPGALPTWSGSALDERNRGCFLHAGTTVCLVGDPQSRTALLMVNQDDINLVRPGQRVRLNWRELSTFIFEGEIVELAALDLETLPRESILRLKLPARATASGHVRPIGTWYQARVRLEETELPLPRGSAGTARIHVDPQTLFLRAVRWIKQTFSL